MSFEKLEPRQMLAADMAEILGVVRTDVQGDGIASNDTVVVGATAALYRDVEVGGVHTCMACIGTQRSRRLPTIWPSRFI